MSIRELVIPYDIGATVKIANELTGVVTAISIRAYQNLYEVVWWDGKTRKCEWLQDVELKAVSGEPQLRIGFRQEPAKPIKAGFIH